MKTELRKHYSATRKSLPNKSGKSLIIQGKVVDHIKGYHSVGVYASMDDEVRTDELIKYLLKNGYEVSLPKVEGEVINFYVIKSLEDLSVNESLYKIREPKGTQKVVPEAVVVPGLSFDKKGNRLGFGKAYFDKYLKDKTIYKIGVCFKEQIADSLPTNEWDILMDIVVTD